MVVCPNTRVICTIPQLTEDKLRTSEPTLGITGAVAERFAILDGLGSVRPARPARPTRPYRMREVCPVRLRPDQLVPADDELFVEREPGLERPFRRAGLCDSAKAPDLVGGQSVGQINAEIDVPGS
jgi:hypothetical protein